MLALKTTSAFHKDYKLAKKRELDMGALQEVIDYLHAGARLPEKYYQHPLHGEYAGFMECHIKPDWLLIYGISPKELVLVRTGSHADLFED